MRLVIIAACAALLTACSPVYKLSISQGNVINTKKYEQLETGMTPEQVLYLMGTPLVVNEFVPDRWDYVSFFRYPDGRELKRAVSVYFESGTVARIEDSNPPPPEPASDEEQVPDDQPAVSQPG